MLSLATQQWSLTEISEENILIFLVNKPCQNGGITFLANRQPTALPLETERTLATLRCEKEERERSAEKLQKEVKQLEGKVATLEKVKDQNDYCRLFAFVHDARL